MGLLRTHISQLRKLSACFCKAQLILILLIAAKAEGAATPKNVEGTPECIYRMTADIGGVFTQDSDEINQLTSTGSSLTCLQKHMQDAFAACDRWLEMAVRNAEATGGRGAGDSYYSHWDDCVVQGYFEQDPLRPGTYTSGTLTPAAHSHCFSDPYLSTVQYCREAVFYFDKNCNPMPGLATQANQKACFGCGVHNRAAGPGQVVCRTCDLNNPLPTGELLCGSCSEMRDSGERVTTTAARRAGGFTCNSCFGVSAPAGQEVCDAGSVFFRLSPISLVWEEDENGAMSNESTIVNFPLDPKDDKKWYVWRASRKKPLLVYDPEHTGKIVSGSQLFGNWTFGGKISSLQRIGLKETGNTKREPWKNGYEALAMLEQNGDGKLTAVEIEKLGLWFDENQNGISEPGEVQQLKDAGVSEIYYQNTKFDSATGDVLADIGYMRTIKGESIVGSSLDWYAEAGESKQDLALKVLALGAILPSKKASSELSVLVENSQNNLSGMDSAKENNSVLPNIEGISGIWVWHSEDEQFKSQAEQKPQGYLTFKELDGKIKGSSFVEAPFAKPLNGAQSTLRVYPFFGSRSNKHGQVVFTFESKSENGTVIYSEATLSEKSKQLNGKSTVQAKQGDKTVTFSYSWTAKRLSGQHRRPV